MFSIAQRETSAPYCRFFPRQKSLPQHRAAMFVRDTWCCHNISQEKALIRLHTDLVVGLERQIHKIRDL